MAAAGTRALRIDDLLKAVNEIRAEARANTVALGALASDIARLTRQIGALADAVRSLRERVPNFDTEDEPTLPDINDRTS